MWYDGWGYLKKNDNQDFWKQSKHFQPKKASYPTKVDNAESNKEICDLFVDKFFNLYNSVSYNNADMEVLKTDIDDMINTQCTQLTHCTHGTHSIISSNVLSAIRNLKHDKKKRWWL